MPKREATWGDGQRLSLSSQGSQEDDIDQPPIKKYKATQPYPNYVRGTVTGQASSVSSGTDDDPDTDQRPVLGTGVADDYVKTNSAASNMSGYSLVAERLMANMGHKTGKGLGKYGQGRVNIVEASQQRGRRGLGMTVNGFEPSDLEWDIEKEVVVAKETVDWMNKCTDAVPQLEEMQSWVKEGPKKLTLDDECEFCSEDMLSNVLKGKSVFDNLESEEMRRARTRSNAFETIRGVFFLNR
ncbi:Cap-specific mRNA (nucleoside-2'-O-)-methyltransferase 1 [Lamellibrachia satsuma]|nr:Cap-specific mRNA (nucleoside-2'-O-)-methyltransferase 1 [Lamellibrachia satsuma]